MPGWLKSSLLMIPAILVFTLVFFVYLYPTNDLKDFVITAVSQGTQNQIYLQFEEMNLEYIPTPGVELKNVELDIATLGSAKADEIVIRPTIATVLLGYFTNKVGGTAKAEGLMGGRADVFAKVTDPNPESFTVEYEVALEGTSIEQLIKLFPMDASLQGNIDVASGGVIDLTYKVQPKTEFQLNTNSLKVISLSFPTPLGPFTLPGLKLNELVVAGRTDEGKIFLDDVRIGKPGDDLDGTVKGEIELKMAGGRAIIGNYKMNIRLKVSKSLEGQFGPILEGLGLNKFKSGNLYAFKAEGNPLDMPKFSAP